MPTITRFEDLEVWQLARELSNEIFKLYNSSELFLKDYKLKDQLNGAAGSIMDNIAEGFERAGRNEFINFLSIAKGSCGEVQSQLYRALDRKYINQEHFDLLYHKAKEIGQKAGAFINYLKASTYKGSKFKNRQV